MSKAKRTDKQRLDWLNEKIKEDDVEVFYSITDCFKIKGENIYSTGDDLRQAIDSAMDAKEKR